jgi:hypothetical protein
LNVRGGDGDGERGLRRRDISNSSSS